MSYILVFGAAWIVIEWLRGTMLGGYPWNPLGVIWVGSIGVDAAAAFIGTYALSGATVALAGSLILATRRRWHLLATTLVLIVLFALSGIAIKMTAPSLP